MEQISRVYPVPDPEFRIRCQGCNLDIMLQAAFYDAEEETYLCNACARSRFGDDEVEKVVQWESLTRYNDE